MTQAVDFFEAAMRHHSDATLLLGEGRDSTPATCLASAECGVKVLLVSWLSERLTVT